MIFRLLMILLMAGTAYYLVRMLTGTSEYKNVKNVMEMATGEPLKVKETSVIFARVQEKC